MYGNGSANFMPFFSAIRVKLDIFWDNARFVDAIVFPYIDSVTILTSLLKVSLKLNVPFSHKCFPKSVVYVLALSGSRSMSEYLKP